MALTSIWNLELSTIQPSSGKINVIPRITTMLKIYFVKRSWMRSGWLQWQVFLLLPAQGSYLNPSLCISGDASCCDYSFSITRGWIFGKGQGLCFKDKSVWVSSLFQPPAHNCPGLLLPTSVICSQQEEKALQLATLQSLFPDSSAPARQRSRTATAMSLLDFPPANTSKHSCGTPFTAAMTAKENWA